MDPIFDLEQFPVSHMLRCGALLRQTDRGAESMEEIARRLVQLFHSSFVEAQTGQPELALIRCYRTIQAGRLPRTLREKVNGPDDMRCLVLLATQGAEAAWCDRTRSVGHAAIGLPNPEFVGAVPMLARLFESFGIDVAKLLSEGFLLNERTKQRRFNVFFVPEALGSPFIPAQDFVREYRVRSVVGFGGVLTDGEVYAMIGFSRVPISQSVAERFNTLTLHARVPLSAYAHGPVFDGDARPDLDEVQLLRKRLEGYEELLGEHEVRVQEQSQAIESNARDMRNILDNVGQGLLIIDRSAAIQNGCSAKVQHWFGPITARTPLWSFLRNIDARYAEAFELGWEALLEDLMPLEVCIAQLPTQLKSQPRRWRVEYVVLGSNPPITTLEAMTGCLVVITDITAEVQAEQARDHQAELAHFLTQAVADAKAITTFIDEMDQRIARLKTRDLSPSECCRELHTLKGNSSLRSLDSLVRIAHDLEQQVKQGQRALRDGELLEFEERWYALTETLRSLFVQERSSVEVQRRDVEEILRALQDTVLDRLRGWCQEPVYRPLAQAKEHALALAKRLGKEPLAVETIDNGVRVPEGAWDPMWFELAHVLRNAVDHGIEPAEERVTHGKPTPATLRFEVKRQADCLLLEVSDDGRGVDWERVAVKARERGWSDDDPAALQEYLFRDSFSTREVANEISGRGVGLGAFRRAVERMGGSVSLSSQPGKGTTVRVTIQDAP